MSLANDMVTRRNKSIYDSTAMQHLARQIDTLYWQSSNPDDPLYGENEGEILRQGDDLTRDEYVWILRHVRIQH